MVRLNSKNGLFTLSLFFGVVACSTAIAAAAQDDATRQFPEPAAQGSRIAFTADREGQSATDEIYVVNADGTREFRLTPTTHSCQALYPRWSPNGRRIAFTCQEPGNGPVDVFVVNDDGTGLRQVTHFGNAGFGSWSPDGNQIVFSVNIFDPHNYIVNVDDDCPPDEEPCGTLLGKGVRPDWSPDGRKIAFSRGGAIFVIDIDYPQQETRLTDVSMGNTFARWSPNGQKIAFESTRDGNREIYVMSANGEDHVRLTEYAGIDGVPSWSPDGRWIVFNRQLCIPPLPQREPNGLDLFAVSLDGSQEIQITHGACQGPGGTFSSDSTFSAWPTWAPGN